MSHLVYGVYIKDDNKKHNHEVSGKLNSNHVTITDDGHTHSLTFGNDLGVHPGGQGEGITYIDHGKNHPNWFKGLCAKDISVKTAKTGISANITNTNISKRNTWVSDQGLTHLRPQQIKVYYWIQVFTSYITQDLEHKLEVIQNILSGQHGSSLDNYLSIQNGGTVEGTTTFSKNLNVFGTATIETANITKLNTSSATIDTNLDVSQNISANTLQIANTATFQNNINCNRNN